MNEWFRTFFDALANDVWRALIPAAASDAEADFIERHLGVDGSLARLLDVPSGEGRIAVRLARRGHHVVGVDLSSDAVARLQATPGGPPPDRVEARLGDMRDLRRIVAGDDPFDGAYCAGNSFSYLDHEGTARFVSAVAGAVRPGGRFVIDHPMVAECVLPQFEERLELELDAVGLTMENTYDVASSALLSTVTLRRGAEMAERRIAHRVTTCAEVVRTVEAVGFTVEGLYGDLDNGRFALGAERLLLVARRNED